MSLSPCIYCNSDWLISPLKQVTGTTLCFFKPTLQFQTNYKVLCIIQNHHHTNYWMTIVWLLYKLLYVTYNTHSVSSTLVCHIGLYLLSSNLWIVKKCCLYNVVSVCSIYCYFVTIVIFCLLKYMQCAVLLHYTTLHYSSTVLVFDIGLFICLSSCYNGEWYTNL